LAQIDSIPILSTDSIPIEIPPISAPVESIISAATNSPAAPQDSTYKVFIGYPNVRFYRTNVQGVCDSSYYNTKDSVLNLMKTPIIWSDDRQLSGDTIKMFPKDGNVDRVVINNNAFVCEFVEEKHYNQLSGKEITGYIVDSLLKTVNVRGNAESRYFMQDDEDKSVMGMAHTMSSLMNVHFTKAREIERIVLLPKPTGSTLPLANLTDDIMYLGNFSWQISKKPISKFDIFRDTNAKVITDGQSAENQDSEVQPKKKTTRRDDVKPIEETSIQDKKRTTSNDQNRPSGFATPSVGGGGSSLGGSLGGSRGGSSSSLRKQF
jgi:hypothetical protein